MVVYWHRHVSWNQAAESKSTQQIMIQYILTSSIPTAFIFYDTDTAKGYPSRTPNAAASVEHENAFAYSLCNTTSNPIIPSITVFNHGCSLRRMVT